MGYSISTSSAGHDDEAQKRRHIIDQYLSAQAEAVMDVIVAGRPVSEVINFTLDVAPSIDLPQPIAGDGVFIKEARQGEVPAGTLVAFYPGTVYMPHEVRWLGGYGPTLDRAGQQSTSHIIGRAGGVRIDGLWSGIEVPATEYALDDAAFDAAVARLEIDHDVGRKAARRDVEEFCAGLTSELRSLCATVPSPDHGGDPHRLRSLNPLAVGEMINHPPSGRAANVLGWPVDLSLFGDGDDRVAYARAAPNTYAVRPDGAPAPGAPCPYTVVLVAASPLKAGDELYLDYGCELLPVEDIPVWFTPAALRGNANELDSAASPAAAIQAELHAWKDSFEKTHGYKPSRHDLLADRVAAALFQTFQKYRKLGDL